MAPTHIKICGITTPEDARAAVDCGADAIGLVFYAPSARSVSVEQAQAIAAVVPPFVTLVALFVDESAEFIRSALAAVSVDLLQFHGDESPAFCEQFQRPWIKALRVKSGSNIGAQSDPYSRARGILLDSFKEGVPGGTGETFDWTNASADISIPVVLAGGLNAKNVGSGIATLRPAAVDVSGGVEASPGVKDISKIRQFVAAVRAADQHLDGIRDDKQH